MSNSNCCFLTYILISQEAGQVVWYSHLLKNCPQFILIHTVKGFGLVNKAEVDVSLELSCFFNDPMDVGNLISYLLTFSKSSLNIWKFLVHTLLKLCLENFEHYFSSMWDDCNFAIGWTFFTFFGIAFFGIGMKTELFQSCGHLGFFQICCCIECSTFRASSFKIWNSSAGISSPPLALYLVMLLRPTWLWTPGFWLYVSNHTIVVILAIKIFFCICVCVCVHAASS